MNKSGVAEAITAVAPVKVRWRSMVDPRQKIAWLALVLAKSLSVEAAARRYGCAPQCQSTFHQRQRDATSSGNRQI
jgi:hypothetical protein